MTFFTNLLKLNNFLKFKKEVAQNNIRKHNKKHRNSTFKGKHMGQARVLTERELRKVLTYIATQPHADRNRCMVLLTHLGGLRILETVSLKISSVLGSDGQVKDEIRLNASQTKGDNSRTVIVSKRLKDELTKYLQSRFGLDDLTAVTKTDTSRALFPSQKNPAKGFSANTGCQLLSSIYRGAQMDGCTSHSGRRFFCTVLSEKGVGIRTIMALSGHKSLSSVQKYLELNPNLLRMSVDRI